MKKVYVFRCFAICFVCISLVFLTPNLSNAFNDENCIRIGNVSPLTGPGGSYAFQAFSGMKLAVEWINKSMGGVLVGEKLVPLKIIPPDGYDTGTNTGKAIALASKLAEQDQVLAIVHSLTSGETDGLYKAMANKDMKVPTIANLSSAGKVAAYTPWGFRYSINEPQQLKKIIKYLKDKFNINTAVLVLEKDSRYANMTAEHGFIPGCKDAGVKILDTVTVLSKDKDFSSQAAKLRSANADMVMVSTFAASGAYVMKEAYRRGLKPKVILGCNGTNSPEYINIGGKAIEGTIMRSGYNDKLPGADEVAAEFKQRFKETMNFFGACGWESVVSVAKAIEYAKIKNTQETLQEDRVKLRDALASIEVFTFAGNKKFEPDGELWAPAVSVIIKSGQFAIWNEKELPAR